MRIISIGTIFIIAIVMMVYIGSALPEIQNIFNRKYDTKGTKLDSCYTCHISGQPMISFTPQKVVNLNKYGKKILKYLRTTKINKSLELIENEDSGDGSTNIQKIRNLTSPDSSNGIDSSSNGIDASDSSNKIDSSNRIDTSNIINASKNSPNKEVEPNMVSKLFKFVKNVFSIP